MRSRLPLKSFVSEVTSSLLKDPTVLTSLYSSVFEDNNGPHILATMPRMTPRFKHIAVLYHFFREHFTAGTFKIFKIATDENQADIFTKGLDRIKFQALRKFLLGW
jgi:hypothetical protein